ncbi:MAG: type III pantothenate kinase, partial [Phycisphaerales bacterium]|jgi:type III pantothenate kinase|nr:type III pantothenate kinase [Phycisphaerales bacterium]
MSTELTFLAIALGNTRTTVASIVCGEVSKQNTFPSIETANIVDTALSYWSELDTELGQIVLASSNDNTASSIAAALGDQTSRDIWQIGEDLPAPIGQHLDPETLTGIDRLLNAAAAWDAHKQACVVVDAGTCITVDFVDGEGTFHGGAIAPGAQAQLNAMHNDASALPDVKFEPPLKEAFGKNTAQAMLQGVFHGIRGMVRQLSEQYAIRYGAYPMVIATGGDAISLFEDDELIERIVPDLQLQGMITAVRHMVSPEEADATTSDE